MTEPAERPDVLYDFLYKDIGRIASYYAQVFRGRLMGVEESSSDRDVHETLLKGSVAVASGEFKSVGDIQSTTRRSIDPHDVITTDILASLMESRFITQNINEAPHGTLVIAQGTLVFIERSMLELAAVSMDMAMQNPTGRGSAPQDRTNRQILKFVKEFLSKLVLPSAFVIRMPSGLQIAGRSRTLAWRSRFLVIRVHLDLWYAVSPMKGGHSHGQFAVSRHPNPPDRGA
jgi:hypothetical protein